jgi:hypothetical protein
MAWHPLEAEIGVQEATEGLDLFFVEALIYAGIGCPINIGSHLLGESVLLLCHLFDGEQTVPSNDVGEFVPQEEQLPIIVGLLVESAEFDSIAVRRESRSGSWD